MLELSDKVVTCVWIFCVGHRLSDQQRLAAVESEEAVRKVREAALEERTEYERIICEMSDKIQQLEDVVEQSHDVENNVEE